MESLKRLWHWPQIGVILLASALPALAGDWPQILGPNRNGIADPDERIRSQFGPDGPPRLWERPVGRGVAGVAVVGANVALFHRNGNNEVLELLDADTGEPRWTDRQATSFSAQFPGSEEGPLCVPTIVGDRIITYGAQGRLSCQRLSDGERLWTRATHDEFDAREGYFGAGSSPLVVDDLVVVNVGGRDQDAAIVGFDLESGEVRWQSVADNASYSSPVAIDVGGTKQVVVLTRENCVSLSPADGSVLFQFPFGSRALNVTAANPVVINDHLFVTASYRLGAKFARLHDGEAEQIWESDELLSSQYTTPIVHEGRLYGIDGRQDGPPANLVCLDPKTRKITWSQSGFGYATLIKADGKLIIVKTDGELVLADLSSEAYRERARARIAEGTLRALPALANGRLYIRSSSTLSSLDLSRQ